MQRFTHRPPPYPVRRLEAIESALALLRDAAWTRLEGAPELEAALAAWHAPDPAGRPPIPWYLASGTAALQAIMLGHGIGPGDEVLTTPYTWAATVAAILMIGATPIFADIDPLTGLWDLQEVEDAISDRCRALLAVHLFGQPCDCAGLRALADRQELLFLEDASQAHGARWAGRAVGDWGDAAAFSCMGLKLLAGTEGGYALFRDTAVAEAAYLYGKHPRGLPAAQAAALQEQGLLDALQLGWRPCAIGAELIRHQLPHLPAEIAARRRNAALLRQELEGVIGLQLPPEPPAAEGCYHLLSLVLEPEHFFTKREVLLRLQERGVECFDYIPLPIHRLNRLNWHDYQGPPVFWHHHLQESGIRYRELHLPGADSRCARSIEMNFNWTAEDPVAMRALAATIAEAVQG